MITKLSRRDPVPGKTTVGNTTPDNDMTSGPLLRKIIMFSLPMMATGVLQLLFNAADLVVAGRMSGENSLAAVGGCGALINMIINVFMGLAVGAGVAVAQDIGAKKYDSIQKVIHTAIFSSFFIGIAVGLFGFFMAKPLLELMNTTPETIDEATRYMRAYFVGIPGSMTLNYAAVILRSDGDTKHPLIFLTISGIANVILNIIITMILGAGNGALSVGIATAVSQYLAAGMIIIFMCRKKGYLNLSFKKLAIDGKQLWCVVKIGIPAGLQGTLFSISNVLIQSTINGYGTTVVAGNTAAANLEGFIYTSMNSLYQAAVTFVGQNVGAKKYKRINMVIRDCSIIVLIVGAVLGAGFLLLSHPLLNIYEPGNEAAIHAGLNRMWVICTTYYLCGLMDVGCGLMRGMGKSITPMIVSLVGSCAFRILWIQLICPLAHTNITVLYISYPISWVLTSGVHYIMVFITKKKLERRPDAINT